MERILVCRDGAASVYIRSSLLELSLFVDQETGKDIYTTLGKVLFAKGLTDTPTPESPGSRLGFKTDYEAISADSGGSEIF